jgi:hypothetical protein
MHNTRSKSDVRRKLQAIVTGLLAIWLLAYLIAPPAREDAEPASADAAGQAAAEQVERIAREADELPLPVFSYRGGFYTEPIELAIAASGPGTSVHYTLDGSEPSAQSPVYTAPITIKDRTAEANVFADIETTRQGWIKPPNVFKGTVVRAAAIAANGTKSPVVTQSYFIHPEGSDRFSLPVISLATDGRHFFDDETGIYVPGNLYRNAVPERPWENPANYTQSGREWERPVSVEFYEQDGKPGFALDAGVRIHGGATTANPIKSLRLYFRKEYGEGKLEYRLFPDRDYNKFDVLVLRSSGNDHDGSLFRDALMHRLIEEGHTSVDTLGYRPAVVFLNGEYWGIHNIRERADEEYIAEKYGIEPNRIDLLEFNAEPIAGDADHYKAMIQYLKDNDIRERQHYEYIQTQMDVDNYIDYMAAQIYYDNTDWPGNNIRLWREKTKDSPAADYGRDGRWRWILYDTDFGFGMYGKENYKHDTLAFATASNGPDWPNPDWSTFLLRSLLKNDDFRERFAGRFADHLNGTFAPERVVTLIDSFKQGIVAEIDEHIARWGRPYSFGHWSEQTETMKTFARERPSYVRQHLNDNLLLGGQSKLRLTGMTAGGIVQVGSIEVNGALLDWEGVYFQGIPVMLTAVPMPGYRFAGWSGDREGAEASLTLRLSGDLTLTPVFEQE